MVADLGIKTVLLAWELGGGLGHLVQLRPLAQGLAQRGYRVVAALRDRSQAENIFGAGTASVLRAPIKVLTPASYARLPMTFAHVLQDNGFGGDAEAGELAGAWRALYQKVRPDLIVFDHAPMALLGARGLAVRRVTIGSGFCVPPDQSPLPNLRSWKAADPELLFQDEQNVLATANRVLGGWGLPALSRITQLYSEVDETLLVTFQELDHYQERTGARYFGPLIEAGGAVPQWPGGGGARIYAYLKMLPTLPAILEVLRRLGHPTIVLLDKGHEAVRRFECGTLRIEHQHLDIARAGGECDLAILNANHGTTAAVLMAGKPILQLPIYLEQALLARATAGRLGAGLDAGHRDPRQVQERLEAMLGTDRFGEAAARFAGRHSRLDPTRQRGEMLGCIEELLRG